MLELISQGSEMARQLEAERNANRELKAELKEKTASLQAAGEEAKRATEQSFLMEKNLKEERIRASTELQQSLVANDELKTKLEVTFEQLHELQAKCQTLSHEAQGQTQQPSSSLLCETRIAQKLLTEESAQHLSRVLQSLNSLESRFVSANTRAEECQVRAQQSMRLVVQSTNQLKECHDRLQLARTAHMEYVSRSRKDAWTISRLQLDIEGLKEQITRYEEEIGNLHRNRRKLEAELHQHKLELTTSLRPLILEAQAIVERSRPTQSLENSQACTMLALTDTLTIIPSEALSEQEQGPDHPPEQQHQHA